MNDVACDDELRTQALSMVAFWLYGKDELRGIWAMDVAGVSANDTDA